MKKALAVIFLVMFSYSAFAANIHGSIYDMSFSKAKNSIVEINTVPNQRFLAVNGSYSFDVQSGSYVLTAYFKEDNSFMLATENISIEEDGSYVMDLFLYPNFEENDELYLDLDFEIDEPFPETKNIIGIPIIFGIVFLFALFVFILLRKPKKKAERISHDLDRLLDLLDKNHGRMTQKEIRKEFALSEAKISLMVAELEHMGKVKKIKQGRGNIIILNR